MTALARILDGDGRSLDTLALQIREAHGLVESFGRSTVEHAIHAGELLAEAKSHCGHGQWLPWLALNFEFTRQTAAGYMRIAENRDRTEGAPSISAALALVAARDDAHGDPDGDEPPATHTGEATEPHAAPEAEVEHEPETLAAPDAVQVALIADTFRKRGEGAAREHAASMRVACPSFEVLAAAPEPVVDGDVVEETEEEAAVDRGQHRDARSAAAVKRLRNVVSTCQSIREVTDGGLNADELVAGADATELRQAVKDITAARKELAALARQLNQRLRGVA